MQVPKSLYDHQAYYALLRYSTPIKVMNLALAEIQRLLRQPYLYAYPYKMIVDTENICNLRCLYCPTGQGVEGRTKGFMSFERFKSIVDEIGRYVYIVDLFDWGEPLLNKDICAMIRYAEQKHLCTNIHSNFNSKLSEENVEQIVSSGLSYLSASLDGADQEAYSIYRRRGSLELALENARQIIAFKKKTKSHKPHMTWQFLVFPHNCHQVELARKMAYEMGFDRFHVTAGIMSGGLDNVKTSQGGIPAMKDLAKTSCDWLWTTATIHWNGGVAPCCLEFKEEDDFGSVVQTGFKQIWNNDKFRYARSLFGRKIRKHEKVICNHCYKVRSL